MSEEPVINHKNYVYFIGVDVSKNKLDFAVMRNNKLLFHCVQKNQPVIIYDFLKELNLLPKFELANAIFCMENTGIYSNHLVEQITLLKGNYHIGNALHIKLSFGIIREKNDKIDAIRLAKYAWKNRDDLLIQEPRRFELAQLAELHSLRKRLIKVKLILTKPLAEQAIFMNETAYQKCLGHCKRSLAAIDRDLTNVEDAILRIISADQRLKRLRQIIMSVPGVGIVTAVQILIRTNEFKDFKSAKKFACYAGISPFRKVSGIGNERPQARVSGIANKEIKALLHICALCAIRHDQSVKTFYEKKINVEKKPKLSAVNAVRNKLLTRIFACVKKNELYSKVYVHEVPVQIKRSQSHTPNAVPFYDDRKIENLE